MKSWLARCLLTMLTVLVLPRCHGTREQPGTAGAARPGGADSSTSASDVLDLPLRAYVVRSKEWPAANCADGFEARLPHLIEVLNRLWRPAGMKLHLDRVAVVEADVNAVRPEVEKLDATMRARPPATLVARAIPNRSRSDEGPTIYFAHRFDSNGTMIGSDTALVSDDPRLRAVEGGTDEPVARVMGHMIGLMFGLTQSGDETNLMAGGTTGMALDGAQIERVRNALPADGVTRAPPADQFLVVPLRSYVLKSDIRALNASPELLRELPRIVAKINRIWSAAGIYFRLQDAAVVPCDDDAAHRAFASLDALAQSKAPREVLPSVVPASTRTTVGFRVYYVHDFVDNGVYPGKGDAFVRETAELVPVRGGIDEPLPRVTAHELGHGLGLGHQENRTHLMAEGTTGSMLGAAEVERARNAARSIPGTQSAEASGFLDEIRPLADRQMAPWSEAN